MPARRDLYHSAVNLISKLTSYQTDNQSQPHIKPADYQRHNLYKNDFDIKCRQNQQIPSAT